MPAPLTPSPSCAHPRAEVTPQDDAATPPGGPACSSRAQPCFTWQSADLLQGSKRVHIAHNGSCYQLQTTRQGKLILTK